MKLQETSLRNSLRVETLGLFPIISVNGPPLEHWIYNTRHCVHGLRQAVDKLSDVAKKLRELSLF